MSAGKNTLQAKDNYKHSGWSVGASLSLASGSLLGFDASGSLAKQNGETSQITYKPSSIRAGELLQLKAIRDTNLIGAKIGGEAVKLNTGNNLNIESLQSIDNFKEHSKTAGFSISTSPKFKGTIGSVGGSVGRIDSKLKTVINQAGIFAGENGYNISTGNTTSLKGAIISSKANKDKNSLTTGNLDINDIKNEAEYNVTDNGLQYNYFGNIKTKSKNELDKIYKHIGITPMGGVGARGKSSSITKSAISDGKITENGRSIDIKTINTDIEHSLNALQVIFNKKNIEEKQKLAHLFSINANEAIHQIAKHEGWKDGDPRKVALHAIVGGTTTKLGGGQFNDGVYAAGLSEAMMPQFKKWAGQIKGANNKSAVDSERLQQLAFVFGYAINKTFGTNPQSGAYVGQMGAKYNLFDELSWLDDSLNGISDSIGKIGASVKNEAEYASNIVSNEAQYASDVVSNEAQYASNVVRNEAEYASNVIGNEVKYVAGVARNEAEYASNVVGNEVKYAASVVRNEAEYASNIVTNEAKYISSVADNEKAYLFDTANKGVSYVKSLSNDKMNNSGVDDSSVGDKVQSTGLYVSSNALEKPVSIGGTMENLPEVVKAGEILGNVANVASSFAINYDKYDRNVDYLGASLMDASKGYAITQGSTLVGGVVTAYTGDVKKGIATAVTLDAGINVIDVWVENNVPMLIIE